MQDYDFVFPYINYKGNFSIRRTIPSVVTYVTNDTYHGEGWILVGMDKEKEEYRNFLLTDIIKGTIIHTLKELGLTVTPERVNGVMNKMKGE